METEQKDAAPQEIEEVIKKKRTRKTNVNFSAQTAGMKSEQLTVTITLRCVAVWQPLVTCVCLCAHKQPTSMWACCMICMQPPGCLVAETSPIHMKSSC